ncbi:MULTISPECIES: hypothetical protein [Clostridia]|uniref:Uncharacterized protein n=1 Tax=Enterocloster citroniae TaxID=358743 RepID=A0ABV2G1H1_9FIRM|nr:MULTISPECIES: hypothetical protein [Clostridia]
MDVALFGISTDTMEDCILCNGLEDYSYDRFIHALRLAFNDVEE